MDFNHYYKNWLTVDELFRPRTILRKFDFLNVNLPEDFFDFYSTNYDKKSVIREAAVIASEALGNKPALCFSGGIDSQVMLNAWLEAGLKFDLFILVFKNDLNNQDVEHARQYCKQVGVPLNEIEIDIIKFLNLNNYEYAIKYHSCSPHFNTHYKLFNILKNNGYTGVCAGGDAPCKNLFNGFWGGNYTRNTQTFIKYSEVEKFPCIGNFIGYYPKLAWMIALNIKPFYSPTYEGQITTISKSVYINEHNRVLSKIENVYASSIEQRYLDKCNGYMKLGFNILPQDQKYTGFENVKKYLENQTGDGWEFEKRYRNPLEHNLNYSYSDPLFALPDLMTEKINSLHINNF